MYRTFYFISPLFHVRRKLFGLEMKSVAIQTLVIYIIMRVSQSVCPPVHQYVRQSGTSVRQPKAAFSQVAIKVVWQWDIIAVPRKWFGSADCDIVYTIYTSRCKQQLIQTLFEAHIVCKWNKSFFLTHYILFASSLTFRICGGYTAQTPHNLETMEGDNSIMINWKLFKFRPGAP